MDRHITPGYSSRFVNAQRYHEQPNYPAPKRQGTTDYKLLCLMPHCPFESRYHVAYKSHVEHAHQCEDCNTFCSNKQYHQCLHAGERLGHVDNLNQDLVGGGTSRSGASYGPGTSTEIQPANKRLRRSPQIDLDVFQESTRSHKGMIVTYIHKPTESFQSVESLITELYQPLVKLLTQKLSVHGSIKAQLILVATLELETLVENENTLKERDYVFNAYNRDILTPEEIENYIFESTSEIIKRLNEFNKHGSGWTLRQIESVQAKVGVLNLFANAEAKGYIKFPSLRPRKTGYLNIKNKCNDCFKFCVAAHRFRHEIVETKRYLLKKQNKAQQRINNEKQSLQCPEQYRQYFAHFDFSDIHCPLRIDEDLEKFETKNNLGINIWSHRGDQIIPVRRCNNKEITEKCNLFLIYKETKNQEDNAYHLVLITDLDKFMCNGRKNKVFYCQSCFRSFNTEMNLANHSDMCQSLDSKNIVFPGINERVKFSKPWQTLPYPFIIVYKFSTFMNPLNNLKSTNGNTKFVNEILPAAYSFVIISQMQDRDEIVSFEFYDGPDIMKNFFKRIFLWAEVLLSHIRNTNNFVIPSEEVKKKFDEATHCHICKRVFDNTKNLTKTFHHNHHHGHFEFAACSSCNLKIKYKHEIPIISQCGSSFDYHLLVSAMGTNYFKAKDVQVIAKSSTEFISITITAKDTWLPNLHLQYPSTDSTEDEYNGKALHSKVKVRFMDAGVFFDSNLFELVESLNANNTEDLKLVSQCIKYIVPTRYTKKKLQNQRQQTDEDSKYLQKPLYFPFKSLNDASVLSHPLPARENFQKSIIDDEPIADDDWKLVQDVCTQFNITTLREYTRFTCMLNTILLAEVWQNYRKLGLKNYELDPTYSMTLPSFSWDCFLKFTDAEIDYIRDKRILDIATNGIRGGQCIFTQKHVVANHERCPEGFDSSKPRKQLLSLDINSLYAHSMKNHMPVSDYEYIEAEDLEKINWADPYLGNEEGSYGYLLVVDLEYPKHLHDRDANLPLAMEQRTINLQDVKAQTNLNKHAMSCIDQYISRPRLMLTLHNKYNYTTHFKALRYYLSKGLVLSKVHCGVRFKQQSYFKKYIEANLAKRKIAKTPFENKSLKKNSNVIYGKTLTQILEFVEAHLCTSAAEAEKSLANPRCKDFDGLSENLSVFIQELKTYRVTNLPLTGVAILEFAKVYFYEQWDRLCETFHNKAYLDYSDTDGYEMHTIDEFNTFWDDIFNAKEHFDFSKIPRDHKFSKTYENQYPNLQSLNKDESGKIRIQSLDLKEIIILKPKMYSTLFLNDTEQQKCKGIPAVAMRQCKHNKYRQMLETNKPITIDVNSIRSRDHKLYTINYSRLAFNTLDLSRIFPDPNNCNYSLPLGHKDLDEK